MPGHEVYERFQVKSRNCDFGKQYSEFYINFFYYELRGKS